MAEEKEKKAAPQVAAKGTGSRKTVDKWKKKKWFVMLASRIFDKKPVAETPAEKPKNLMGRTIRVTMDILTGQRARRDYTITFKVNDIQGQTASTKVSAFDVSRGVLGRTIRRRNSKASLVQSIPVIGGEARSTIVVVTERKATRKQESSIRKLIKDEYATLAGKDFEDLVQELLMGNFTNELGKKASKICLIKRVIVAKSVFSESK